MMGIDGPRLLLAIVVVGSLLAGVTFLFLQKAVKLAGHLRAVDELSRHIKDDNGLIENGGITSGVTGDYSRLADGTEILEMDDFPSDDENVIHFDRSSESQQNGKNALPGGRW